jgi:hypothetical protein
VCFFVENQMAFGSSARVAQILYKPRPILLLRHTSFVLESLAAGNLVRSSPASRVFGSQGFVMVQVRLIRKVIFW